MGIIDWFRKRPVAPAPAPSAPGVEEPPLTDEVITEELTRAVAKGYDSDAEVLELVTESLAGEHGERPGLADRVARLAQPVFEARAAEEQSWPVPTDCDRLDRAFERLERAGIVARQNFTCCQTCGHAEIWDEVARARGPVKGYTFFHMQDTDRAAEGGGLYFAYGAVLPEGSPEENRERASAQIAAEVVAALQAEGLSAAWSGDPGRRIELPLEWQKRRRR